MNAWYENDIQRLQQEINDLQALDVFYEIDSAAKEQKLLRIKIILEGNNANFVLPDKSKHIELFAVYPDFYPYFRPNVYAYDLSLPRHQNPLDKGLCLLGRPTDLWNPKMTLARFLQEQLPILLVQGEVTDEKILSRDETEQAEPISEYFNAESTVIFDPPGIPTTTVSSVEMIGKITVGIPKDGTAGLRYAVLQIKDCQGNVESELPKAIENIFSEKIHGVLYKIPELEYFSNPKDQFNWLVSKLKEKNQTVYFHGTTKQLSKNKVVSNVIGLNFPEETGPGKKEMVGWIFLVGGDFYKPVSAGKPKVRHHFWDYAKASRISDKDINIRIPKLKPLAKKTIVIVGLGSLGAASAIDFARNGVAEIRLVDYDVVDAATTVRWPLGITVAGISKTWVIKNFIESNYPSTNVEIINLRIGQYRANGNTPPSEITKFELDSIEQLLKGVSLIYEATAEEGVTNYLSEIARANAIPFMSIWATYGAVGGQVLRILPEKTQGCWMCSMWYRFDETIKPPPFEESGKIQPRGCGDITFTGTSFDLQNVSCAGVRMAISTLCEDESIAYPSLDWDISVLSMANEEGIPIAPTWQNYKLEKHPNCTYCGNNA